MSKFIIQGNKKLKGEIEVKGAKNAALPIIAATLLTDEVCYLENIPRINDVFLMLEILKRMGSVWEFKDNSLTIQNKSINPSKIDKKLVGQMRASILLAGPLLARFGKAKMFYPGGCLIGARPIDTHLRAFQDLGTKISRRQKSYYLNLSALPKFKRLILKEISVTATENAICTCALSPYLNEIRLAALEPEVEDLINFLIKMGVSIKGKGTHNLKIIGQSKLKGIRYRIIPDRIEAVTFAVLAAATRSNFKIKNVNLNHLDSFLNFCAEVGLGLQKGKDYLIIKPTAHFNNCVLRTDIYPGLATDFQAPLSVLLTKAKGKSKIFETLFEGRLNYLKELKKMGAKVKILNSHEAEIYGPTELKGARINSLDLRAGATLVIAALTAKGESIINNVEVIDRGYENLEGRLKKIGTEIKRIK